MNTRNNIAGNYISSNGKWKIINEYCHAHNFYILIKVTLEIFRFCDFSFHKQKGSFSTFPFF